MPYFALRRTSSQVGRPRGVVGVLSAAGAICRSPVARGAWPGGGGGAGGAGEGGRCASAPVARRQRTAASGLRVLSMGGSWGGSANVVGLPHDRAVALDLDVDPAGF